MYSRILNTVCTKLKILLLYAMSFHYSTTCTLFIYNLALTLPLTTALADCCFSIVKNISAPQRLSMDFKRISHFVLLAFNKGLTFQLI